MDKIAANSALAELFALQLKLLKGQITPAEFHHFIWSQEKNEEISLYRQLFPALWKKNEKQWGPAPVP
jgi:hypothetical protein